MRHVLTTILLVLALAMPAVAQIICTDFGAVADCGGPNGQSWTQVPLGPTQGVIITDQDTMPYTFIQPQTSTFDPSPLPTMDLLPTLEPSVSGGIDSLLLSPGGDGGMGTMFMLGQ